MSYLINFEIMKCCGCGACAQICPMDCIQMEADQKGFLYPKIYFEKCNHCNLCLKVCPYGNDQLSAEYISPEAYAAIHKDEKVHLSSSSGGAFTAIADAYCDEETVVFGASYNNMQVCHTSSLKEGIGKFRKSKYVQSNIGNSFDQARKLLIGGQKVLFTGVPCQIAGLRQFLGKDYPNLLTVDLICHGVASPRVFRDFIDWIGKKHGKTMASIDMRRKLGPSDLVQNKIRKSDQLELMNVSVAFEDGEEHIGGVNNLYIRMYTRGVGYRDSCYECPFYIFPRQADITLGDCWGVEWFSPEMFDKRGVSLIIFNTVRGRNLLKLIQNNMKMKPITMADAIVENNNLKRSTRRKAIEESYWQDYFSISPEEFFNKYGRINWQDDIKRRARFFLTPVLPPKIHRFLKKHIIHQ